MGWQLQRQVAQPRLRRRGTREHLHHHAPGAARLFQRPTLAQQISLSTQQQKTASSQVVLALREIVTASSHTAQSITRISQVSKDMAQLSGRLDELVHQFKLNAASGTTQG